MSFCVFLILLPKHPPPPSPAFRVPQWFLTLDCSTDALRAHGIIPPKEPSRSPSPEPLPAHVQRADHLKGLSLEQANRALDEGVVPRRPKAAAVADEEDEEEPRPPGRQAGTLHSDDEEDDLDKVDDDEERLLQEIRAQRMAELRAKQRRARFGRVYPISRPDYKREVTDASAEPYDGTAASSDSTRVHEAAEAGTNTSSTTSGGANPARPKGTPVICLLYKSGQQESELLRGFLHELAGKYPASKFVDIPGTQAIEGYPDRNMPTLLVYIGGQMHRQIVGLTRPEIGLSGMTTKLPDIELLLAAMGAVIPADADPNAASSQRPEDNSEPAPPKSSIRQGTIGDDDDDLDWD